MSRPRKFELPTHVAKVGKKINYDGSTYVLKFRRQGAKGWESVKNKDKETLKKQESRWRASLHVEEAGQKIAVTSLSSVQLRAAESAFELMHKHAYEDAEELHRLVDWAIIQQSHLTKGRNKSLLLVDCVKAFLQFKKSQMDANNIAKPTYVELARYLLTAPDSFASKFPDRLIDKISPLELRNFIDSQSTQPKKGKCRSLLYRFYQYASGNKDNPECWIARNPLANTSPPQLKQGQVASYSYKEIKRLMTEADKLGLLPYLIFRLFSLARREEVMRLFKIGGSDLRTNQFITKDDINFTSDMVKTRKEKRKGGRMVSIDKILKLWIAYFKKHKMPLKFNAVKETRLKKVIPQIQGRKSSNLLRHTAITFHAKHYGNSDSTAMLAGHTVEMLWNRYYAYKFVSIDEAGKLYELTPEKALKEKIIKIPKKNQGKNPPSSLASDT